MGLFDFLGDIPIIGGLFKSSDDGDGRSSSIPIIGDVFDAAGNYIKAGLNAPLNNYYRHQQLDDAKDMMAYSSDLQHQNWQKQFSTITQYNDPAAASARMRNAGFSPSAIFGTGGSAMFSSATPNAGMPSTPSGFYGGNANFSSLAQALNLASQTKLNLARLPEVQANVQSLLSKAGLDDSQKSLNQLSLKFQSVYGDKMYQSNIAKNVGDYLNKLAQAELFNAQGDTQRAEKLLKEAQADLAKSQKGLTDSQKTLIDIDAKYEEARIQADIDAKKASSQEARAAAKRNLSESALADEKVNTEKTVQVVNKFVADLKETERNFNQATFDTRFRKMLSELETNEIYRLSEQIRLSDLEAYNAFQRILLGKTQKGDANKLWEVLHDFDKTTRLNAANPK